MLLGKMMTQSNNFENTTKYLIQPSKLEGQVEISGAKNSVLRLMAASILTSETIGIDNYPASLGDVQIHLAMLEALGKSCEVTQNRCVIREQSKIGTQLIWHECSIRNTLLILGALTSRYGEASVPLPGGCVFGNKRKYDLHVMLLEKFGAKVYEDKKQIITEAKNGLVGTEIILPIRSTGATENAVICAVLAKGKTVIWGPHIRPEIMDLISMLRKMGAKIEVFGQERIEIKGVEALTGTTHKVIPDNMEALTWMIGAVITQGDVEIFDFPFEYLEVPLSYLRESGAKFKIENSNSMIVTGGSCYPVEIATGPYPGINSDMQPLFALYGALSNGESRIIDIRFPGRYAYADQLKRMGMSYDIDGNMLKINGRESTIRESADVELIATDLRAGAAFAMAGFVAQGQTTLHDAWQIERGYDCFVSKAKKLNAKIDILGS